VPVGEGVLDGVGRMLGGRITPRIDMGAAQRVVPVDGLLESHLYTTLPAQIIHDQLE
jgi:hypothetical protein